MKGKMPPMKGPMKRGEKKGGPMEKKSSSGPNLMKGSGLKGKRKPYP